MSSLSPRLHPSTAYCLTPTGCHSEGPHWHSDHKSLGMPSFCPMLLSCSPFTPTPFTSPSPSMQTHSCALRIWIRLPVPPLFCGLMSSWWTRAQREPRGRHDPCGDGMHLSSSTSPSQEPGRLLSTTQQKITASICMANEALSQTSAAPWGRPAGMACSPEFLMFSEM